MQDSRDLSQQAAQEIEALSKTSPTPAGHSDAAEANPAHIEAINQVFALFRLNYHNQYFAAFPDARELNQAKKLWLESLAAYPVEQILRGAKHAIETSEYLPTLNRMHECCLTGLADFGLPTAHDAYVEAFNAASPKTAQPWSHPAVYLAGRDADWFFLANNIEQVAWPVYRDHYQRYCAAVMRGDALEVPRTEVLEQQPGEPLSAEEQLANIRKLREESGL